MTPKNKAENLVVKFLKHSRAEIDITPIQSSKQIALIAVDEIMLAIPDASDDDSPYNHELKYWQEVKQEISNI
jgi:hypothetical protein